MSAESSPPRGKSGGIRLQASARPGRSRGNTTQAGFTLLELLVVIVIIGLLAGLVAPKYFDQVGKSNVKIAKAQIDSLEKALDQYRLDVGAYPTTEQGLAALTLKPANLDKWQGPYLKKPAPPDPWGRAYLYKSPGDHGGDYDLSSLGRDGQPGGTGEDQDATSWVEQAIAQRPAGATGNP